MGGPAVFQSPSALKVLVNTDELKRENKTKKQDKNMRVRSVTLFPNTLLFGNGSEIKKSTFLKRHLAYFFIFFYPQPRIFFL